MKFRTKLLLGGKTATGIQVPEEVVAALGQSKRPPVIVTVNGYTYRNTIASMGGRYMISVSAEHRAGAGIAAGDELEIELELDTQSRKVTVPADFAAALSQNRVAQEHFDNLSYSNRLRYVLAIESAKAAETRQRRITKTLEGLQESK